MRNPADFTVSRQNRWHDEGKLVVEVTRGGLDYTGPDALSPKYDGEFKTFLGMHKALEVAIEIAKAWHRDLLAQDRMEDVYVDVGENGGGLVNLTNGVLITDEAALEEMLAHAEEHDESLEKCEECGGFLPAKGYRYTHDLCCDGEQFCSERCVEKDFDAQVAFDSHDTEEKGEIEEVSDGHE